MKIVKMTEYQNMIHRTLLNFAGLFRQGESYSFENRLEICVPTPRRLEFLLAISYTNCYDGNPTEYVGKIPNENKNFARNWTRKTQ